MTAISDIGLLTAFAAGMISFLSPCVLPLVPGYISYVSGASGAATIEAGPSSSARLAALIPSAGFVLGFSTVFVALGAGATLLSRLLLSYRYETTIIGGLIIVLFGIVATGLVPVPWLERDIRYHGSLPRARLPGAYMLGLAFGFGWTPCIGPVLGAILTMSAMSSTTMAGIILLTTYSLGLGIPFLLSAAFTERLMRRMGTMRRAGRWLKIGAGSVMIIMGIAMASGYMSVFSYWLLETFPIFSTIG
jgi:cytochrome c-type biogenesis protein